MRLSPVQHPEQATVDHVIPRWKGGSDEDDNIVGAHQKCNQKRNLEDMPPAGYARKKIVAAVNLDLPTGKSVTKQRLQNERDAAVQIVISLRSELGKMQSDFALLKAENDRLQYVISLMRHYFLSLRDKTPVLEIWWRRWFIGFTGQDFWGGDQRRKEGEQ